MSVLAIAFTGTDSTILPVMVVLCLVVSGFFGVAFAVRVGGADMPVTISLLNSLLEDNGAEVLFAIHPVAGRMPGHMNVLLCEVDISYDKLCEMDDINPKFKECDVVLVIGANDVVNPAANTAVGTPIYGMPVLEVDKARHIIICNYDLKPGYAGVENPLYHKEEGVTLLMGDARDTIEKLITRI